MPKDKLDALLHKYGDVFAEILSGMPPDRPDLTPASCIPLEPGTRPIDRPMFRYSPRELEEMKSQLTHLIGAGLIEPSSSPWGAPVLFVRKPRSTALRMCVDWRALNSKTIRNVFPIPRIDELLDQLQGAKCFSSLDLTSAYWQLKMPEAEQQLTAFKTPFGLYQFKTLAFGLCNAPSIFAATMNRMFGNAIGQCCLVYLDDILIFSNTPGNTCSILKLCWKRCANTISMHIQRNATSAWMRCFTLAILCPLMA